jgi:hypothetical protein
VDVLGDQVVVLGKNLLDRPSPCEQVHDEFNGDPCPFDDRFADQYLGIDDNAFLPSH